MSKLADLIDAVGRKHTQDEQDYEATLTDEQRAELERRKNSRFAKIKQMLGYSYATPGD